MIDASRPVVDIPEQGMYKHIEFFFNVNFTFFEAMLGIFNVQKWVKWDMFVQDMCLMYLKYYSQFMINYPKYTIRP